MNNFLVKGFFLFGFLGLAAFGQAQEVLDTIFLKNPSFERGATSIGVPGWTDCGFVGESPYDVHSGLANHFNCEAKPSNGKNYIGMVVRDNETYESMSQRLYKPLKSGKCYSFSLKLARSKGYRSPSRSTGNLVHYTTPARIRIWGGTSPKQKVAILAETGTIVTHLWKAYYFKLNPTQDFQYLIIEAYYKSPTLFPYNGNVIIDDASNIYEMQCDDTAYEVITAVEAAKRIQKIEPTAKIESKPEPPTKIKSQEAVVVKTKTVKRNMPELNEKMSKGQVLAIPQLAFNANSYEIPKGCTAVLVELYDFMVENPTIKIEIGGHTNNRCDTDYCNKLSEYRAKAIADDLVTKGIARNRVTYKGYGKTNPRETNSTAEGRKMNQRVEITIM